MFACCRFGFWLAGAAAAQAGVFVGAGLILDKVSFRHLPPGGRNPGALCLSDIMHPVTHGMPFRHFALRAWRPGCASAGIPCGAACASADISCASADAPLSKDRAWGELAVLAVLAALGFSGVPGAAWALAESGVAFSRALGVSSGSGALVVSSGLRPQSSQ